MNEEDYDVDEEGQKRVHKYRLSVEDLMAQPSHPPPPASAKKQKRKRSPSPPPKIGKRKRFVSISRSSIYRCENPFLKSFFFTVAVDPPRFKVPHPHWPPQKNRGAV